MDRGQSARFLGACALVERAGRDLGGGTEPILVSLPERDRRGQLCVCAGMWARFGRSPSARGWLTGMGAVAADRPVDAGYRYTVLDDNHMRSASVKEDAMWALTQPTSGPR